MNPKLLLLLALLGGDKPMKLAIESPAFDYESAIPTEYTCEGNDVSPPLRWKNVPEGTESFALIVDDPDAPDPKAPQRTWVHWVLYDLPADSRELPQGVEKLPQGTKEGLNDWKRTGYGGPCPPIGRHRYFFKLYALDTRLEGLQRPTKTALLTAMQGHVLGQAELMGTYQKTK